jgi:hypothetical protein
MKKYVCSSTTGMVILLLALVSPVRTYGSSSTAVPKGQAKTQLNPQSIPDLPIPQSVFTVPSQPSEGRNPFFPQSTVRVVVPKIFNKENPIDVASFVLNGITSPPRRTAMINGRTFEPGEEGEVKLPGGGKQLIKCEEIKSESAIIVVAGQRRELHLRSGV